MIMGLFLKELNVTKILERGAFKVWEEIKVGEKVFLKLEETNKNTILVEVEKGGQKMVFGELPEKESEVIRSFLTQKWNDVFEAYICKKDNDVPLYDQRISIAVYIEENKEVIAK